MVFSDSRDDITAKIKEEADIVQIIGECVDLKRSGTRFLGLCPFHGEKTPSFSVHSGQQFFHCFGCGESGDVFSFVMKYHSLDFPEAVKTLANRYHIALPERRRTKEEELRAQKRELLFAVNEKAATEYNQYLKESAGAKAARNYLHNRGVSEAICSSFRIGYAPAVEVEGWNYLGGKFSGTEAERAVEAGLLVEKEKGGSYDRFRDRIVFPISDLSGRVCGFGGRIVGEGQPKYLNSPESPVFNKSKLLLGLYQQKEDIRRKNEAVLVEGNFDLISLVASGCKNVVAPLGTALTREQLRLIKRFAERVTLLFDGDVAGEKAAVRGVPFFLAEQVAGRVALLPDGHDPDTFIRENGLAALNKLLEQAESLPEFVLNRLVQEYGLTLDGKRRIVEELQPLVKAAVSPLQRSVFVSHFAEKLGMPMEQLNGHLNSPPVNRSPSPVVPVKKNREERIVPLSIPQRQLVEFMILQPKFFFRLEDGGIRECLAGGVGEVLFLQLKGLLAQNPDAEPEELLTLLPGGAERSLVADLLLRAPDSSQGEGGDESQQEFSELVDYLKRYHLKKTSEELMKRMQRAEQDGDSGLWQELMVKKIEITNKLHGEQV
ncbi:MAG: DNA primase [Desulfobulbaceae bacterium]|nr:DNA primase [Desulfobulbaceae bacterium]